MYRYAGYIYVAVMYAYAIWAILPYQCARYAAQLVGVGALLHTILHLSDCALAMMDSELLAV